MQSFSNLRKAALAAYIDSKRRRRRFKLKRAGIIALALILLISGLAYAAVIYASNAAIRPPILDPGTWDRFVSLLLSTPPSPTASPIATPSDRSATAAQLALPSPIPTATPTPTATATPTITPTKTPLYTDTPTQTTTPTATRTVTPTPSRTLIPSPTLTPSKTPSGAPPSTSTFTATTPPTATPFPDCSPSGNSGFESALLTLINSERESSGLSAYEQQSQLQAAAQIHSTDMACKGFFSHVGSDGSSVGDRVNAKGYDWLQVDESIFGIGDISPNAPQLAFNFWMASPPNHARILHDEYTDIGVGYIHEPSSPFGGYFTVVFARP